MQKISLLFFMFFILNRNIIKLQTTQEITYEEYCNIQNPGQESDCTQLDASYYTNYNIESGSYRCCFERFRINKVITTRCRYLEKTKSALKEEKKYLRDDWKVKNLTILCNENNIKYSYFLFGFLGILF